MRIILLYILLVAFGCQQTPFLESENLKNSESEKGFEPRAMSNEPFSETENLKTSESEKISDPRAMSNEPFLESEKSVNISEICGNEKTNHKLGQKKSEKSCEPRAMSNEPFFESENLKTSESEKRLKSQGRNAQSSQLEAQSPYQVFNFSDSQILYFENQIRLADSLYKNYLPQYNFEEVKAAVMFFDSCEQRAMSNEPFLESENLKTSESELETENLKTSKSEKGCEQRAMSHEQRFRKAQSSQHEAQSLKKTVDCCPLSVDIEYLRARAHYYHAVGLTERDDIVGACEHYFIALEIMESETENLKTSKYRKGSEQRAMSHEQKFRNAHRSKLEAQSPDYEKIRFIALIYTRLGRLFYNENYCDLAMLKYKKALKYVEMLDEKSFKANVLKELGNSCQLANKPDSALYYYKESLKYNSSLPNKLDVEKSIAQILFYEGKRDSAYMLLKNNLYKINNDNVKYSYHYIIGDLFYHDKKYDSALYYLEESLDYSIINKRIAYTTKLSTIYDSLGDYEKRNYYDNISSKLFKDNVNKEVANKRIQVLYNNFKERNNERERNIAKVRVIKLTTAISLSIFVIVTSLLVLIRYKYKRRNDMLSEEINAKAKYINDNEFRYSLMEGKIKSKNAELHQKEEQIKSQQSEIAELRNSIGNKKNNLKEYCRSEICIKIFNRINELSKSGKDTSELKSLSQEEFVLLLQSAKQHLSLFFENISSRYPSLKKEDLYYLCLNIINLNDKQIAALFGVTYQAIRTRRKKICVHLGINMKENLHNFFIP